MSLFFGSVLGSVSPGITTGDRKSGITSTIKTKDKTITTKMNVSRHDDLIVEVYVSVHSTIKPEKIFSGTFDNYVQKFVNYE